MAPGRALRPRRRGPGDWPGRGADGRHAADTVWELRPYRVCVLVGVAARPEFAGQFPAVLADRLAKRISALEGGAWDVAVSPAPATLQRTIVASLSNVAADDLPKDSLHGDKVILLQIAAAEGGWRAAAREFDAATGLWSAPAARSVRQLSKLPDRAGGDFSGVRAQARVSTVKDRQAVLRLRASALEPRDPGLAAGKPGGVFRLAARSIAGDGPARRTVPLPWTFCTVEQATEEGLRCRLDTGLRDPLAGRWESSLEVLALGVAASGESTELTLKSAADASLPLAGCDVYASDAGTETPVFLGRTDRRGIADRAARRPSPASPSREARRRIARPPAARAGHGGADVGGGRPRRASHRRAGRAPAAFTTPRSIWRRAAKC